MRACEFSACLVGSKMCIRASPTFDMVRVERDGSAIAAGRSLPGARIELKANGEIVAETTADDRGERVAVIEEPPKPAPIELRITAHHLRINHHGPSTRPTSSTALLML